MADEEEVLTQRFMSDIDACSAHDVDRIVEESGGAGAGLGLATGRSLDNATTLGLMSAVSSTATWPSRSVARW